MAEKIRKEIAIDEEKLKWIQDRYGDVSLTWFFDQLLTGYMLVHTHSPMDYAKAGARAIGEVTSKNS